MRGPREFALIRPTPVDMTDAAILAAGEAQAAAWGLAPLQDLDRRAIARLGVSVGCKALVESHEGPWGVDDDVIVRHDGRMTVMVRQMLSTEAEDDAVATALGHLALHWPAVRDGRPGCSLVATFDRRATDPDDVAALRQARLFMRGLRMPLALVAGCPENTAEGLARRFSVTRGTAEARMRDVVEGHGPAGTGRGNGG